MADAWGVLTFSRSADCEFNSESLVATLNQFQWENWGGEWQFCSESNLLWYSIKSAMYPTVFPVIEMYIHCSDPDSGQSYSKMPEEMNEDDWTNFEETESEPISLEQLKLLIQPHISAGWIEIACCCNEKSRYVEFGRLRIEASGVAERSFFRSGPFVHSVSLSETA